MSKEGFFMPAAYLYLVKNYLLITLLFVISSCGTYKISTSIEDASQKRAQQKSSIADADKDGVQDKFDRCPNTPPSVPVNSHGCPKDTDGDGVPDYKDKELITPSDCQPSDDNGVGNCNRK